MARPPSKQPTDGEMEILRILWEDGPCELGQVRARLQEQRRSVATTTVATRLEVMLEKGLVRRTDDRPYRWSARVTQRAAARGLVGRIIDGVFDGSAGRLVAHLIEDGQLSDEERQEIVRLLASDASSASDPNDAHREERR